MAYKKETLIKKSLDAIKKYHLVFIDEIPAYLPCSLKTFYNFKLQELQTIKENLATNKIKLKQDLREKWYKSENATLQMAAYKLLSDDIERRALAMDYHEHSTGDKPLSIEINYKEPIVSKAKNKD